MNNVIKQEFGVPSDWQVGQATVQWLDNERHDVVCVVTPNYTFYWRGRVDYSNFAEDYQYHGERFLPSDEPVSSHLTLYRETTAKSAQEIRCGDVVQALSGQMARVTLAEPMRVYQEVAMHTLRSGNHRHWQNWLFSHLLRLDLNVT